MYFKLTYGKAQHTNEIINREFWLNVQQYIECRLAICSFRSASGKCALLGLYGHQTSPALQIYKRYRFIISSLRFASRKYDSHGSDLHSTSYRHIFPWLRQIWLAQASRQEYSVSASHSEHKKNLDISSTDFARALCFRCRTDGVDRRIHNKSFDIDSGKLRASHAIYVDSTDQHWYDLYIRLYLHSVQPIIWASILVGAYSVMHYNALYFVQ